MTEVKLNTEQVEARIKQLEFSLELAMRALNFISCEENLEGRLAKKALTKIREGGF